MARRALAGAPLQQTLFEPTPPESRSRARPAYGALWAALHLPRLSLEVLSGEDADAPRLVAQLQGGQPRAWVVSETAHDAGVRTGMTLTEAYALCPELVVIPRNQEHEQAALRQLAEWAGQYTSMVSLEPDGLLLELACSLRLFGGLDRLLAQLRSDAAKLDHVVTLALAPTAQSALLLACCGEPVVVEDSHALRSALGGLPITALPLSAKQAVLARRLGLRTLRDLWRLPSDGLAKRFGTGFTDYLDRLLGHTPEPRLAYQRAPTFSSRWAFPMETDKHSFIFHALEKLTAQLVRFMRRRALSLTRLEVVFYHSQRPASRMELGSRQACHEAAHLLMLLHEKLEREQLVAPVVELELVVTEFHDFVPAAHAMFADGMPQDDAPWEQFLDKLQTRLGRHAVTGLQLLDDHRPERAWDYGAPLSGEADPQRPAWLLPAPQRLANSLQGMQLLSEPERIEGGWWDGFDIRRDYYRAVDGGGRRLWLYRDLNDRQWYLHGLFA
ncbi:MAG: DNA polymerase Y family protein [Pseudomonadota bacterium]